MNDVLRVIDRAPPVGSPAGPLPSAAERLLAALLAAHSALPSNAPVCNVDQTLQWLTVAMTTAMSLSQRARRAAFAAALRCAAVRQRPGQVRPIFR